VAQKILVRCETVGWHSATLRDGKIIYYKGDPKHPPIVHPNGSTWRAEDGHPVEAASWTRPDLKFKLGTFREGFFTEAKLWDEFLLASDTKRLNKHTTLTSSQKSAVKEALTEERQKNTREFVLGVFQVMRTSQLNPGKYIDDFNNILIDNNDEKLQGIVNRAVWKTSTLVVQTSRPARPRLVRSLSADYAKQLGLKSKDLLNGITGVIMQMHRRNKYTFWHFGKGSTGTSVPFKFLQHPEPEIATAPSSPQELPSPGPEPHLESSRRLFGIEDYTCLLRIAFWLFVAILLAILCTILVRYYRRRGRINGYVLRAVHNFKRSVRFVSEKHKPFRREDLVVRGVMAMSVANSKL